jgi:hypothetical protein
MPELPSEFYEIDGCTPDAQLHLPAGFLHLDGAFNGVDGGKLDEDGRPFLVDGSDGVTSGSYLQFVIVQLETFGYGVDGVVRYQMDRVLPESRRDRITPSFLVPPCGEQFVNFFQGGFCFLLGRYHLLASSHALQVKTDGNAL